MDTDTYSKPSVIAASKNYVSVRLDGDQSRSLAERFKVSGFPHTILLAPDGETIGVFEGYVEEKPYLERLGKLSDGYSRLAALKGKDGSDPEVAFELAQALKGLERYDKAVEHYSRIVEAPKADPKTRARAYAGLMETLLLNTDMSKPEEVDATLKKVDGLLAKAREGDPKNQHETLDDIASIDASVRVIRKDFEGAARVGQEAYSKYPTGDKSDMVLYLAGFALYQAGKQDEAIKAFREVADKFPNTFYGGCARQALETPK
jgi:tetratricopeptide (TPR) repeat protein